MTGAGPVDGSAATLPAAQQACAARLVAVAPMLMREFRSEMRRWAPADLSVPLFRALILAHVRPGASVSELAGHLGVTLPTASVAVGKLIERGLLAAGTAGQRRRLQLTPAGQRLVAEARNQTVQAFALRLAGLDAARLARIEAALGDLDAALNVAPAGRATTAARRADGALTACASPDAAAATPPASPPATPASRLKATASGSPPTFPSAALASVSLPARPRRALAPSAPSLDEPAATVPEPLPQR